MAQRRIFVTGSAGFIGSHFVEHMLSSAEDISIVALDKMTYAGNRQRVTSFQTDPRFTFVQGDICDADTVRKAMQGCSYIVNFAAETHVDRSIAHPDTFIQTDVVGVLTLLEVARDLHIERFLQISTDEVYGNAEDPCGSSRPSLETDTLNPLSPYAASKAAAERLAFSYWATFGLPVIITRCTNNYGPYQYPEKQIPLFIAKALQGKRLPIYGDGSNTRDWIYVRDHCRALAALLSAQAEDVVGEVFNIGTGEERSVLDNARTILHLLNVSEDFLSFVPDRPGHVRRHAVNVQKLHTLLGWAPQTSFIEGLAITVAWYQQHSQWLEQIMQKDAFLVH